MSFDQSTRTKVLLWCDRHCCVCKKPCGANIEVHHIIPESENGADDVDNAIPLCFDCHCCIGNYNSSHPKGNKYKTEELKARREQVYEEFTRHLIPPIFYELTDNSRTFPDVGFTLAHHGDSLPVKVKTVVDVLRTDEPPIRLSGHYSGERLWNLNPRFTYYGHFELPPTAQPISPLRIRVAVTVIDQYERYHEHLPIHFVYVKDTNSWYMDP